MTHGCISAAALARCLAITGLTMLCAGAAVSQASEARAGQGALGAERMLTDAEVKAKYRHCPDGYFSGPQPGKARYTKNHFVWAVTPEFAARFCMPPEFIVHDLQGVDAVAYRMFEDDTEETCGWGGLQEVCRKPRHHRFEIYYPSGTLPKRLELPYYSRPTLASKMLISESDAGLGKAAKRTKAKPRGGSADPFAPITFTGYTSLDTTWPLSGTEIVQYYEELFERTDFIAIDVATGFSSARWWQADSVKQLGFSMLKAGAQQGSERVSDRMALLQLSSRVMAAVLGNEKARIGN